MLSHLTDEEVADICRPLRQHAARIRYLQGLGLPVERRPDGSPLVRRSDWERQQSSDQTRQRGPRWTRAVA